MYVVFGMEDPDIDTARRKIEAALGVRLVPHDSFYLADYWLGEPLGGGTVRLRQNLDLDGLPAVRTTGTVLPLLFDLNGTTQTVLDSTRQVDWLIELPEA